VDLLRSGDKEVEIPGATCLGIFTTIASPICLCSVSTARTKHSKPAAKVLHNVLGDKAGWNWSLLSGVRRAVSRAEGRLEMVLGIERFFVGVRR
jgi:hypothetical protein